MRGEPTPAWDSGNYTNWEEYFDITLAVANSLILLITSVVGTAANIFVIVAVYRQKSLQTSNNALVVNLAVIDFLRCVIDCPILLLIIMTVYQRRHVNDLICDIQMASFSFSCCIQLLTLACISAERYQAIAQPFKTSQRKRRIMVVIPLTWVLAILIAVFCLIFLKDSPVHVRCQEWQTKSSLSYDNFGLYILFPLWAVCFGIIIGFYARIFALVRSHNRKIFDKGSFPPPQEEKLDEKQKNEETTVVENGHGECEQKQSLSVSAAQTQAEPAERNLSTSLLTSVKLPQCVSMSSVNKEEIKNRVEILDSETEQPHPFAVQVPVQTEEKPLKTGQSSLCAVKVEEKLSNGDAVVNVMSSTTKMQKSNNFNTEKQSKERPTTGQAQLENPESTCVPLVEQKQATNSNGRETLAVVTLEPMSTLPPVSVNAPETDTMKQDMEVQGAVCMMPSKASRERASKKKESKMAKRAGYIIISFLLFWLPLITTILLNFIVYKNKNVQMLIVHDVEILSVSVACITSLSDPIIYAAVNPQFRTEFYRLKNRVKSIFNKK